MNNIVEGKKIEVVAKRRLVPFKERMLEKTNQNIRECFNRKWFWIFFSVVLGCFIAFMKAIDYYSSVLFFPLGATLCFVVLTDRFQVRWERYKKRFLLED